MFFEEGNCRAVRLLHEASHFLEACLEKLHALEQEALSELKNETVRNKNCNSFNNKSSKEIEDKLHNVNTVPSISSEISNKFESSCISNAKHSKDESPGEPEKVSIVDLEQFHPMTPETSKRKLSLVTSSEDCKRIKCGEIVQQSDEEVQENSIGQKNQLNINNCDPTRESNSESRTQVIKSKDDSEEPV